MAYSLNLREDEVKLAGKVSVTERTDGQVAHFRIVGESAEVIYYEMKPDPVYDECLGGYYKKQGNFLCFVLVESPFDWKYSCNFGINLSKQTLRKTVVCD